MWVNIIPYIGPTTCPLITNTHDLHNAYMSNRLIVQRTIFQQTSPYTQDLTVGYSPALPHPTHLFVISGNTLGPPRSANTQ